MRCGTLFVVTHYLPLIANADAILVLERGRIVQQGRHDELVREGRYAELWADFVRHLG
jgi:ABC-type transport system involved in Fe-S cluster assembly fused permease/ATPase subunit